MKIIDPNSPLVLALGKLSDIVLCNIMFVIFSLPLFTIGASYTALCNCMQKLIADTEDDLVARDFWRAFKVNFKQATLLWLLCLVVIGVLSLFYYVASSMLDVLGRGYLVPFFLMVILFLCGYLYLFPIQARYKLRIQDTIKNAWLLSVAALPWTLLALGITIGSVYLTFGMMRFDMGLYIWAVLGFGVVCYLNCLAFQQAFKKMDPATPLRWQTAPEEAIFLDESHRSDLDGMTPTSGFSNPDWNRQEYPLTDRKDVKGKGSRGKKPRR